jgi:hypothetical protein
LRLLHRKKHLITYVHFIRFPESVAVAVTSKADDLFQGRRLRIDRVKSDKQLKKKAKGKQTISGKTAKKSKKHESSLGKKKKTIVYCARF